MKYKTVKITDSALVKEFILNAGASIETFRYFNNRDYDVINKHIITYLIMDEKKSFVGYGHLEKEDNKIWLGIAIAESHTGLKLGVLMLEKLISTAKDFKIDEIYLTVDASNFIAVNLYSKYNFKVIDEKNGGHVLIMKFSTSGYIY
jgi:ribosomal-protein-alanine N-acetyltransferase